MQDEPNTEEQQAKDAFESLILESTGTENNVYSYYIHARIVIHVKEKKSDIHLAKLNKDY